MRTTLVLVISAALFVFACAGCACLGSKVTGRVADAVLDNTPQEALDQRVKDLAVEVGADAIGCALDELIKLFTDTSGERRSGSGPSPATKARERAKLAREHLPR